MNKNILDKVTYKVEKLGNSQISLSVEIDLALYNEVKAKELAKAAETVTITGFRVGKAPLNMVEAQLGANLIEKTLQNVLPEVTSEIIYKEELKPMDQVDYHLDSVDPMVESGPAVKYTAKFTTLPTIKIADLTKIKVTKDVVSEPTAEEIQKVKDSYIQQQKSMEEYYKNNPDKQQEEFKMPTDEQIVESQKKQKEYEADQKYKSEILKKVTEGTEMEFPESLVPFEAEAKEKDYVSRIESLGLKIEDFLKMQNTTIEEIRKTWTAEARESIQVALILGQIVRDNQITLSDEELAAELKEIQNLKSEDEKLRAMEYVRSIKLQQKALDYIVTEVEKN